MAQLSQRILRLLSSEIGSCKNDSTARGNFESGSHHIPPRRNTRKAKKIDGLFFNLLCRKFNYFQFCRGIHMGKDAVYLGHDDIL